MNEQSPKSAAVGAAAPTFLQRREGRVILGAFALLLLAGLFAFKDYGLGWDDWTCRASSGQVNWNYITRGVTKPLLEGNEKYHGPAYELFLLVLEKVLFIKDIRNVYLMRHAAMFLTFFLATIAFFRIARRALGHDLYALCACAMLVLSPRIFQEAFINSKDLAFLSFFIFAAWSLFRLLEKQSYFNVALHALICGLLIDIRLIGLLAPAVTVACLCVLAVRQGSARLAANAAKLSSYLALCTGFVVLFWPVLWLGPWFHFSAALEEMRKYHWEGFVLYMGANIKSTELPWHYLPYWIFITTPLLYTALWACGAVALFGSTIAKLRRASDYVRTLELEWLAIVAFFAGPLGAVIVLHSVVYDSWRHVFCVYPFFILIAAYGIKRLVEGRGALRMPAGILVVVLAVNSCAVAWFMVQNHPHQNVYFNGLAQLVHKPLEKNFELDYWGLSYRQGLEHILELEPYPNKFKIAAEDYSCKVNLNILESRDRERIEFVDDRSDANYFLTNYRGTNGEYPAVAPYDDKVFKIVVCDVPILGVYRMKPR